MTTIDDDVLASSTRRRVVAILASTGQVSFETLSARLSAAEGTGGTTAREYATYLHHVDLPRLVEAGYVTWNWAGGEVAVTEAGRRIAEEGSLQVPQQVQATDGPRELGGGSAPGTAGATGPTPEREITEDGHGDD